LEWVKSSSDGLYLITIVSLNSHCLERIFSSSLTNFLKRSLGQDMYLDFGLTNSCKSQILPNVNYITVCLLFYVVIVLGSELDSMENWLMKVWQIENRVSAQKHITTLFSSSNDVSKKLIIVVLPLTLMSENFAQITALDPSALCSN
jgi:hypothetical protein